MVEQSKIDDDIMACLANFEEPCVFIDVFKAYFAKHKEGKEFVFTDLFDFDKAFTNLLRAGKFHATPDCNFFSVSAPKNMLKADGSAMASAELTNF
jgi:hypothetical protein